MQTHTNNNALPPTLSQSLDSIRAAWDLETADAARRKADHWLVVQAKQREFNRLQEEISSLGRGLPLIIGAVPSLPQHRTSILLIRLTSFYHIVVKPRFFYHIYFFIFFPFRRKTGIFIPIAAKRFPKYCQF